MQHLTASAIVCATRAHGETGVIARFLTENHGIVAGYVAGGRGRVLRPVLIPGNLVAVEFSARSDSQLPSARPELLESRGPWLSEPLPAAGLGWATALTAASLPERQPFPALWASLAALLTAICHAPSARGWAAALVGYESLLLRELGYGVPAFLPDPDDFIAILDNLDRLGPQIARHALADHRADVMGARAVLRERLGKIA
jgi:DNA repair protein RecO (recombination protein O)